MFLLFFFRLPALITMKNKKKTFIFEDMNKRIRYKCNSNDS